MRPRFLIFSLLVLLALPAWSERTRPLLDGWVRHQLAPFNNACPEWLVTGSLPTGQRTKVGCVATALESILSYHGRPVILADSIVGRTTEHFAVPTLPMGMRIDVTDILPRYEEGGYSERNAEAVAQLSLLCGAMAQMNYGLNESGANVARVVEPLRRVLGWKSVAYLDSYQFSPEAWLELLRSEIRAGRPVLYTGYTMNLKGHAFVLDGYDDDGRFHFNFGYGGAYDSCWYRLDAFNIFEHPDDRTDLGVQQGFFCNQMALLLAPDSVDFHIPDTLVRTGREVVVEDMTLLQPAERGIFTPIRLTLRNTSDRALTTPFELFTNLPTDTLIFRQGDYGALHGATLQAGEQRTFTIHARFDAAGERILRLSPDDSLVIAEQPLTITEPAGSQLVFGTPSMDYDVTTQTATFLIPLRNEGAGRSGDLLTFGLMPTADLIPDGDFRHYAYAYLASGEAQTLRVDFRGITPGSTHTFVVRAPWTIRRSLTFTAAPSSLSSTIKSTTPDTTEPLYDLSGRRVSPNTQPTIIVRKGEKLLRTTVHLP